MTDSPLPFFGNPDNTHCFQASIRMLLKLWFPEEKYSWEDLELFTGKKPNLWTWPMRGMIELHHRGVEVVNWREFDYTAFAERGGDYLYEVYGPDKAKSQIEHCDLLYEQENAREMEKVIKTYHGLPSISDIQDLLEQRFLVICNVNSKALNLESGYSGHFVVLYEATDEQIHMHDPGPPHCPNRVVSHEKFLEAWEYPTARQKNLMAFRYPKVR